MAWVLNEYSVHGYLMIPYSLEVEAYNTEHARDIVMSMKAHEILEYADKEENNVEKIIRA